MTLGSSERPVEILLVEDSPGDVELTQRILSDSEFALNISVAEDGEVAMAYLRGKGKHANATRPDLILLDLAMPKKDGYEVLDEMTADPTLRSIPVMLLTAVHADRARLTSLYAYDISPSRSLLGLCQKPIELARIDNLIKQWQSAPVEALASPSQRARRRWWPFGNL